VGPSAAVQNTVVAQDSNGHQAVSSGGLPCRRSREGAAAASVSLHAFCRLNVESTAGCSFYTPVKGQQESSVKQL
jgi:hypothetical protein